MVFVLLKGHITHAHTHVLQALLVNIWSMYYGCYCSVTQPCLTLCDTMDCRIPGFPVLHHLWELAQTHPLSQWCHPTILSSFVPFSSCLQTFPASRVFSSESALRIRLPKYWVSASASVLPMSIQGWFLLGLTGWISFLSKGLSRVTSNTTVQKHQFFGAQLSL